MIKRPLFPFLFLRLHRWLFPVGSDGEIKIAFSLFLPFFQTPRIGFVMSILSSPFVLDIFPFPPFPVMKPQTGGDPFSRNHRLPSLLASLCFSSAPPPVTSCIFFSSSDSCELRIRFPPSCLGENFLKPSSCRGDSLPDQNIASPPPCPLKLSSPAPFLRQRLLRILFFSLLLNGTVDKLFELPIHFFFLSPLAQRWKARPPQIWFMTPSPVGADGVA